MGVGERQKVISYNSLRRDNIESVTLCKKNDTEYADFLSKISISQQKKTYSEKNAHYRKHKAFYDNLEMCLRMLSNEKTIIEITQNNNTCEQCYHSQKDKYKPHIADAYVCWINYRSNNIIKRIKNTERACSEFSERYDNLYSVIIKDSENKKYDLKIPLSVIKNFNEKETPDKYIYLAWHLVDKTKAPQNDHTVNYNRIKSVLNNIFGYDFLFEIGKKGLKFESDVRELYIKNGHKINPLVFKIKYKNQTDLYFKVMDVYFYDNNTHNIIEVFNSFRQVKDKITQINDYEYLLIKTGINGKINKILVTDEIYDSDLSDIPTDIILMSFNQLQSKVSLNRFFGGI